MYFEWKKFGMKAGNQSSKCRGGLEFICAWRHLGEHGLIFLYASCFVMNCRNVGKKSTEGVGSLRL